MDTNEKYPYETLKEIAKFLKKKAPIEPKIGIICGSGMSGMVDSMEGRVEIKYDEIPDFPKSTVLGHDDTLLFGRIASIPVVVMTGRFHFYEGYTLQKCCMPIRVFKLLGCTSLIMSNAAGSINPNYQLGDVMIIKDHLNLLGMPGTNPLRGPNEDRFGERFPSMNNCYDKEIRRFARKTAEALGWGKKIHTGVYTCVGGPTYETIAEAKMFLTLGTDAIGMSTVPEVIVARHCGLKVFGFSLICDLGRFDYDNQTEPNHEEILKAVDDAIPPIQEFLKKVVEFMGVDRPCKCIPKKK